MTPGIAPRTHAMNCRCARCHQPHPGIRRHSRAARLLIGGALGVVIVLILAAAGGPSPLVIIGQ